MIALLTLLACTTKAPPATHDTGTPSGDTGATTDTGPAGDTADTSDDTVDSGDDTAIDTGPVDTGPHDDDEDGYLAADDCDDHDANTYPGAEERCGDGVVNDCDSTEADATATCGNLLTEYGATASWLEGGVHSNQARLAGLGDINGDGYEDISVGFVHTGYHDDHGDFVNDSGVELIYQGPVTGEVSYHDYDARFISGPEFDYASWDTTGMGDMDGDGVDDLLIGNGYAEVNGNSSNGLDYGYDRRAWVLVGPLTSGTVLAADADVILHGTEPTTENGDSYGGFGLQARVAGDTDGDGRKEVLVGDWSAQLYLFDIADAGI